MDSNNQLQDNQDNINVQQQHQSLDENQNQYLQQQSQQQQMHMLQQQQQQQMQQQEQAFQQQQQQQQVQDQKLGADEVNATESNVQEFIEILEKHRKKCEFEGKYVEAEMAKNRIAQIKAQEVQKAQDNLRSKQLSERLEVEQAHLIEFNQFNQLWDKKMQEFQQNAYQLERQLIQKHEKKMKDLREELENQISTVPKPSPELLNLRKIQESLAKQKDYAEAHKVQQRAIEIEAQEKLKFEAIREQKIASKEAQMAQKQNIELQALKKRINTSIDEQRKSRAIELERLLQRYQNIKKELESQQQLERINKETESKKILSSSRAFSGGMKSYGSKGFSSAKKGIPKSFADRRGFKSKKSESQESGISPPSAMLK